MATCDTKENPIFSTLLEYSIANNVSVITVANHTPKNIAAPLRKNGSFADFLAQFATTKRIL